MDKTCQVLKTFLALLLSLWVAGLQAAEPMRYIYPPPDNASDRRYDYYWELLKAALDATVASHGPYDMAPYSQVLNATRAVDTLAKTTDITVLTITTSTEREQILLPLRIPLDKGLPGYRLFLIRGETQEQLNNVRTLDDLKKIPMGQGSTWVDVQILRQAGTTVEPGITYESLFHMLEASRFDLFPRGVNEIGTELAVRQPLHPKLAIEKNLLLYYPLARYFFFARTPQGEALANRVEAGLKLLARSGEFDRRYERYKQQMLAPLNLSGRRLFRIPNPMLPPETPLNKTELWDNLSREISARK